MEQCIGIRVADTCYCLTSWLHGIDKVNTMCSTPEGKYELIEVYVKDIALL